MVDEALAGNTDLLIAAARVDEARALLGEANSFFWPSVDAQAGVSRQQVVDAHRHFVSRASRASTATTARRSTCPTSSTSSAGCAPTRPRRAHELEASEASREAVRLALAAQAAKSYFALRALDEQVASDATNSVPARRGARAAEEAPAGRRDLRIRAAPARGRDRRGARAAAAARARARARGSGARRAARPHAAQRVLRTGCAIKTGVRRSARRAGAARRACPPSCCCAAPTWSRPSSSLVAGQRARRAGARGDVPLDQPDRLPRQRERGARQPVLRRPAAHVAARRRPDASRSSHGGRLAGAARRRRRARARGAGAIPAGDPQRVRRSAHRADRAGARARELRRRIGARGRAHRNACAWRGCATRTASPASST